jgi:hypothetical protein
MTGKDNLRMLRDRASARRQRLFADFLGRPNPEPPIRYLERTQRRIADIDAALHERKPGSGHPPGSSRHH